MRSHFTTHQLRFVANGGSGGSGGSRLPHDSGWGKDHHYGTREQADEILKSHNVSLKARLLEFFLRATQPTVILGAAEK